LEGAATVLMLGLCVLKLCTLSIFLMNLVRPEIQTILASDCW